MHDLVVTTLAVTATLILVLRTIVWLKNKSDTNLTVDAQEVATLKRLLQSARFLSARVEQKYQNADLEKVDALYPQDSQGPFILFPDLTPTELLASLRFGIGNIEKTEDQLRSLEETQTKLLLLETKLILVSVRMTILVAKTLLALDLQDHRFTPFSELEEA